MFKTLRISLEIIFYIPIKILHTSMQYTVAILLGTVKDSRILPSINNDAVLVPYIEYDSQSDFARGVIAISPIFYFLVFTFFFTEMKFGTYYTLQNYLFVAIDYKSILLADIWKLFFGYFLFFASFPTTEDIKKFGLGIVSPGGFIFITLSIIIVSLILKYGVLQNG